MSVSLCAIVNPLGTHTLVMETTGHGGKSLRALLRQFAEDGPSVPSAIKHQWEVISMARLQKAVFEEYACQAANRDLAFRMRIRPTLLNTAAGTEVQPVTLAVDQPIDGSLPQVADAVIGD